MELCVTLEAFESPESAVFPIVELFLGLVGTPLLFEEAVGLARRTVSPTAGHLCGCDGYTTNPRRDAIDLR